MLDHSSKAVFIVVTIAAVGLFIFGLGIWLSPRKNVSSVDVDRIRVVDVDRSSNRSRAVPSTDSTVSEQNSPLSISDVKMLEAAAIQSFPMLYAVRIECQPDCTLVATLGPNATTGDWPQSQWPYDGNFERFLAEHGYAPRGPLSIDEPGDNDTLLSVPISLPNTGTVLPGNRGLG